MAPYRGRSQQTSPVADAKEVHDRAKPILPRQFAGMISQSELLLRRAIGFPSSIVRHRPSKISMSGRSTCNSPHTAPVRSPPRLAITRFVSQRQGDDTLHWRVSCFHNATILSSGGYHECASRRWSPLEGIMADLVSWPDELRLPLRAAWA